MSSEPNFIEAVMQARAAEQAAFERAMGHLTRARRINMRTGVLLSLIFGAAAAVDLAAGRLSVQTLVNVLAAVAWAVSAALQWRWLIKP